MLLFSGRQRSEDGGIYIDGEKWEDDSISGPHQNDHGTPRQKTREEIIRENKQVSHYNRLACLDMGIIGTNLTGWIMLLTQVPNELDISTSVIIGVAGFFITSIISIKLANCAVDRYCEEEETTSLARSFNC